MYQRAAPAMNTPTWHQEPVKSYRDIDYFYRTKRGLVSRQRVLLTQITGTLYTEYAEREDAAGRVRKHTWLEMRQRLQRARPENREKYLSYYDPDREHVGLALQQHGSDYLIDGGNNRLCTWKFAEKESVLAVVQAYVFDAELWSVWQELIAQRIRIIRLDEQQQQPSGHWQLQLGELFVTCLGRAQVLSFARAYAAYSVEGAARLWLRLTYKRQLFLRAGDASLNWQAGITEHASWYQRIYPKYLRAYMMQQELIPA